MITYYITKIFKFMCWIALPLALFYCQRDPSVQEETPKNVDSKELFANFYKHFAVYDSGMSSLNEGEMHDLSKTIPDSMLQVLLLGHSYWGLDHEKQVFEINDDNLGYQYVAKVSIQPAYSSLIIGASSLDPDFKWKYYLLNYTPEGKYIDGMILSYRKSSITSRMDYTVRVGEYRILERLGDTTLKITDVCFNNQAGTQRQKGEDNRYYRESTYQITPSGNFQRIKTEEYPKEKAKP
jgi:hypothetical protein